MPDSEDMVAGAGEDVDVDADVGVAATFSMGDISVIPRDEENFRRETVWCEFR